MTDYIRTHISKSLLDRSALHLQELAAHRRSAFAGDPDPGGVDHLPLEAIRQIERDADDLRNAHDIPFAKETVDKRLAAIDKLIADLRSQGINSYFYYGEPADNLRMIFNEATRQRQAAMDSWAALLDHQRINLRAVVLMVERALKCATHSRKNATLYVLLDSLQDMLVDLNRVSADDPGYYDMFGEARASWEYRRLAADHHHLRSQLDAAEKRLAEFEEMKVAEKPAPAQSHEESD